MPVPTGRRWAVPNFCRRELGSRGKSPYKKKS